MIFFLPAWYINNSFLTSLMSFLPSFLTSSPRDHPCLVRSCQLPWFPLWILPTVSPLQSQLLSLKSESNRRVSSPSRPFPPHQVCIHKWVKLPTSWGGIRCVLCMAPFVNSMAFVNSMVELVSGTWRSLELYLVLCFSQLGLSPAGGEQWWTTSELGLELLFWKDFLELENMGQSGRGIWSLRSIWKNRGMTH